MAKYLPLGRMAYLCLPLTILEGAPNRIPKPCVVGSNPTGGADAFCLVRVLFGRSARQFDDLAEGFRPQQLPPWPRQGGWRRRLGRPQRRRVASSACFPAACATKASISDRGMGTSRAWCVFGAPDHLPLTFDTLSRCRIRSTDAAQCGTLAEPQPAQPEHQDHQPVHAGAIGQTRPATPIPAGSVGSVFQRRKNTLEALCFERVG